MKKGRRIGIGSVTIDSETKKNILKVLNSNRLSYGDFSRKFESEMADLHDRKYSVFLNSGTSALQIALQVLKDKYSWKDGDEVLVPSVTFVATSNVVLHNKLKPVFVDVENDYFCMDPEKIKVKITNKTRAIIPVHLFGQSSDMMRICAIAKRYKLKIIEDSCETMFVKYAGKPVGSLGDIACFSTYATHLITTGVGGFAMTNDSDLAIRLKSYCNHGRDGIYLSIDDDDTNDPNELFKIVDRRFSFIHLGHSFRLTELEAAIGVSQLKNWKGIIAARQKNAAYLCKRLSRWSDFIRTPKVRDGATHAFMLFPLVITSPKVKRNKLIEHLEINGVETRYMMPLLTQPIYRKLFGDIISDYPVAKDLNNNGFIIGCHQDLTNNDLEYIASVFDNFFKKIKGK